ncbi:MAG: hypothetical protein V1808_04725 [Candidatus Daviesbacteria bacterium]
MEIDKIYREFTNKYDKAVVIAENVINITPGRLFIINFTTNSGRFFIPHIRPSVVEDLNSQGTMQIRKIASKDTPLSCSECDLPLEREVIWHNWNWMVCRLRCKAHPDQPEVWDFFPKYDEGQEWDLTNSIVNSRNITAPPLFKLTQDGIKPLCTPVAILEMIKRKRMEKKLERYF